MDDRDDSMQAWAHEQELEHQYFEEVINKKWPDQKESNKEFLGEQK